MVHGNVNRRPSGYKYLLSSTKLDAFAEPFVAEADDPQGRHQEERLLFQELLLQTGLTPSSSSQSIRFASIWNERVFLELRKKKDGLPHLSVTFKTQKHVQDYYIRLENLASAATGIDQQDIDAMVDAMREEHGPMEVVGLPRVHPPTAPPPQPEAPPPVPPVYQAFVSAQGNMLSMPVVPAPPSRAAEGQAGNSCPAHTIAAPFVMAPPPPPEQPAPPASQQSACIACGLPLTLQYHSRSGRHKKCPDAICNKCRKARKDHLGVDHSCPDGSGTNFSFGRTGGGGSRGRR